MNFEHDEKTIWGLLSQNLQTSGGLNINQIWGTTKTNCEIAIVTGTSDEIGYVWCLGWEQEGVEGERAGYTQVRRVR